MSEVENAFGPHVEEQVENGEVGQETVFLLIYLIIRLRLEIRIRQRVLGTNRLAKVLYIVYS